MDQIATFRIYPAFIVSHINAKRILCVVTNIVASWLFARLIKTLRTLHSHKTYLGKPYRNHQDWFDTQNQELQTLMSKGDQAHHRVLQTGSIRSTTAAYKDACRLLQKTHPYIEVGLVGNEGSGAAESCCQ